MIRLAVLCKVCVWIFGFSALFFSFMNLLWLSFACGVVCMLSLFGFLQASK